MLSKRNIRYIEIDISKKRTQNFQSAGAGVTLGIEISDDEDPKEAYKELRKYVNSLVDREIDSQLKEIENLQKQ